MNISKTVSLVKSLYHVGKIRLTEKGPELLDKQVVVVPRELFTALIELYADDPTLERTIYNVMQRAVYDFCASINEDEDMEPAELLHVLLKLTKLNGYGNIEISDYDAAERTAAFYVRDLPSDAVDDDYAFKGDTYWAGMLAGGMQYVFGEPVAAVETQCVLEDATSCRFVVGPHDTLQARYPDLYREKFGQFPEAGGP